jgi:hypothetical protein
MGGEHPQRTLPKTRRLTELERTLVCKFRHFNAGTWEPRNREPVGSLPNFRIQELKPDWAGVS